MRTEDADPVDLEVGARVRAYRIRAGLTQAQVGAAVGVTLQQIQKYETGTNRVSASMLVRLARALDTPVLRLYPEQCSDTGPEERSVDLSIYPEGPALAAAFASMSPERRTLLGEIARAFAEEVPGPRPASPAGRRRVRHAAT